MTSAVFRRHERKLRRVHKLIIISSTDEGMLNFACIKRGCEKTVSIHRNIVRTLLTDPSQALNGNVDKWGVCDGELHVS